MRTALGRRALTAVVALALAAAIAGLAVAVRELADSPDAVWTAPPDSASGEPVVRALELPNVPGSVRFAVIGDSGRGDRLQYDTAEELARWHERFAFQLVLMLGDNIYGPGTPEDLALRFDRPYAALLDRGVRFHAVVGNHDPPTILSHPPLGMNGHRYYAFERTGLFPLRPTRAAFFALDTVNLDNGQLRWFDDTAGASDADWKIAFYHHPLYTSGQYRWRAARTRWWLESRFVAAGIDVGFSGHEHIYERVRPQRGVQYFTSGAAGALRPGDLQPSDVLAAGFDADTHFVLVEIAGDMLHFQAVSRTGRTIDHGSIGREPDERMPPAIKETRFP